MGLKGPNCHIAQKIVEPGTAMGASGHSRTPVEGGHVEHWSGGHARIPHGRGGVCGWLQEDAGFPDVRHQAEQRLVKRGASGSSNGQVATNAFYPT